MGRRRDKYRLGRLARRARYSVVFLCGPPPDKTQRIRITPVIGETLSEWHIDKYGTFHDGPPPAPGTPEWDALFRVELKKDQAAQ